MKLVEFATALPLVLMLLTLLTTIRPTRAFLVTNRHHHHHYSSAFGIRGGGESTSPSSFSSTTTSRVFSSTTKMAATSSKPFAVIVQAEIKPDRMEEFLEMIQFNAENSRKEPGCIRFDVLRSQDNPNQFTFYELYKDMAAVDFHKAQPHYAKWADFKESGGTVTSVSHKNDGEFVGL